MTDTTDTAALREQAETAKACGGMFATSGEKALSLLDQLEAERQRAERGEAAAGIIQQMYNELKGEQVPVGTGIFTRDELAEVCKARVRDMPENYADHQIAKVALRSLFTAPQKPVVLPKEIESWEVIDILDPTANPEDYACCVGADMYNAAIKACRKSVQAAGGIVKEAE